MPVALAAAELATAVPENGGLIRYVDKAFGKFWGFQAGMWVLWANVVANASYSILMISYIEAVTPLSTWESALLVLVTFLFVWILNVIGLTAVGALNYVLLLIVLAPFIILMGISCKELHPHHWIEGPQGSFDLGAFASILLYNLMGFSAPASCVGEVEDPQNVFPKGMFYSVLVIMVNYLLPVFLITGASKPDWSQWQAGYFTTAAGAIGGRALLIFMTVGAVISQLSVLLSALAMTSRSVAVMGELRMLPEWVDSRHPTYATPWASVSIISFGATVLALAFEVGHASSGAAFNDLVSVRTLRSLRALTPAGNIHDDSFVDPDHVRLLCATSL